MVLQRLVMAILLSQLAVIALAGFDEVRGRSGLGRCICA
jgi:hypothetical protein